MILSEKYRNRSYCIFNDMINIKDFHPNLLNIKYHLKLQILLFIKSNISQHEVLAIKILTVKVFYILFLITLMDTLLKTILLKTIQLKQVMKMNI